MTHRPSAGIVIRVSRRPSGLAGPFLSLASDKVEPLQTFRLSDFLLLGQDVPAPYFSQLEETLVLRMIMNKYPYIDRDKVVIDIKNISDDL